MENIHGFVLSHPSRKDLKRTSLPETIQAVGLWIEFKE
jgi:hypothetical protein